MALLAAFLNYDPYEQGFTKKEARRFSKFVQYAIIASDEAMAQSKINLEDEDLTRFACVFGSGIGGIGTLRTRIHHFARKGSRACKPTVYSYDDFQYGSR